MLKKYYFLLILIIFSIGLQAQSSKNSDVEYFKGFQLPKNVWKDYAYASFTQEMSQFGFQSNPGVSTSDAVKHWLCDDECAQAIKAVYVERLLKNGGDHADGGVIIYWFENDKALQYKISQLEKLDYEEYLQKDNYLIYLWNNEEEDTKQKTLMQKITKHYQTLGAQYLEVKPRVITFTEEELEKARAEYEEEEVKPIFSNPNKTIKHLFVGEDVFIVFFSDGTLSICPNCDLNMAVLESLKKEPPYTLYLESSNGVVIQPKERDMDESTIIDFGENEMGDWYIINAQNLKKIP